MWVDPVFRDLSITYWPHNLKPFLFFPAEYEIGQPVIGSPCSYVINFAQKRTGAIISPTYPGAYPKDMSCTYQFIGKPNQRVRIEFRDFDLFFGGPQWVNSCIRFLGFAVVIGARLSSDKGNHLSVVHTELGSIVIGLNFKTVCGLHTSNKRHLIRKRTKQPTSQSW